MIVGEPEDSDVIGITVIAGGLGDEDWGNTVENSNG
jgi:hypothetical protein